MFYNSTKFLGGWFKKIVLNDSFLFMALYCIALPVFEKRIYEVILYYLYKICNFLLFPDDV
jgi:hypothetical protein